MSYINRKIKQLVSKFNKLNISDNDSSLININHKNCYNPEDNKPWCKECVPRCIIEGWHSENYNIDELIKDTIYNAKYQFFGDGKKYPVFLEWVPFDRFEDIKQIGKGGFAKVYSATWVDGQAKYERQDDGSWKNEESSPMKIALKKLNDSQDISVECLNELKIHWDYSKQRRDVFLRFYGMTKDPVTKEFVMIVEFSEMGNLKSVLSKDFNNISWKDKIMFLYKLSYDLKELHKLGYCHKDLHSGNILQVYNDILKFNTSYISDFGLSGPSNKQKSDSKICGVLPYVAPEVLNGEPYTLSSDIYSFGVIMTELSSGKPPFYKRKHDAMLALEICNGLRPEFGKGTPEIYKKLAYGCMNAIPNQRPTADELHDKLFFWRTSYHDDKYQEKEEFGYKGKEIKAIFEEADKEIPNISTTYEKNPDAIYTSRLFTFSNLSKPINSPIITSYLNEEDNKDCQDSQLLDLEVSSSLQSRDS